MNLLNQINFPAFLISQELNYIEKVRNSHYLKVVSKNVVKENSLKGCYLFDTSSDKIYVISGVNVLGEHSKRKWYDFTFGNTTIDVDLIIEEVYDINLFDKCRALLELLGDKDAYSIEHEN